MSFGAKKTKEKSTQTVTPTNAPWVESLVQQQANNLQQLGQVDPRSLVPGASPLMQQSFQGASQLGYKDPRPTGLKDDPMNPLVNGGGGDGYSPSGDGFDLASSLAFGAARGGANTTTAAGMAPTLGYRASGPATAYGYEAPQLGEASTATNRNLTDVDLSGYFNPFEQRVIDTTLADYDVNSGRQLAAGRLQAAQNGGQRNSNNAIRQAVLEGEQARGRASTDANLRYQGYNTATGNAQSDLGRETANNQFNANERNAQSRAQAQLAADARQFTASAQNTTGLDYAGRNDQAGMFGADALNRAGLDFTGRSDAVGMFNAGQGDKDLARQLEAAGLIGNLSTAQGANTRADLTLQNQFGQQQREIDRQQLAAPYDLASILSGLTGELPLNLFNGSNTVGTGSSTQMGFTADLMKLIEAGAKSAATLGISDVRMKQDITPMGQGPSGDNLYEFGYKGDPSGERYIGPMAQEVQQTNPGAVTQTPGGPLAVDYGALGLPSPSQQSLGRSLAPEGDPLSFDPLPGGPDLSGLMGRTQAASAAQIRSARAAASPTRNRRGLFGGRMVG